MVLPRCDEPPRALRSAHWRLVPLVVALSFGSHAVGHALAPAEPTLAQLGLSPMAYAVLSLSPTVGQILLPALWGFAFSLRPRLSLCLAPLALVLGQLLATAGIVLRSRLYLLIGIIVVATGKAGVGVIQHAVLAMVLPTRTDLASAAPPNLPNGAAECGPKLAGLPRWDPLVAGLCIQVASSHLIGAGVVYAVPHLIDRCIPIAR